MNTIISTIEIRFEEDVVMARQRARQIAQALGFDSQDQTRIAIAVSEIARNAFKYAGGGKLNFGWKANRRIEDGDWAFFPITNQQSPIPLDCHS